MIIKTSLRILLISALSPSDAAPLWLDEVWELVAPPVAPTKQIIHHWLFQGHFYLYLDNMIPKSLLYICICCSRRKFLRFHNGKNLQMLTMMRKCSQKPTISSSWCRSVDCNIRALSHHSIWSVPIPSKDTIFASKACQFIQFFFDIISITTREDTIPKGFCVIIPW